MENIPKTIYLNLGVDKSEDDLSNVDFNELVDVSWSDTKINDQDIEYTLKGQNELDILADFVSWLYGGHDKEVEKMIIDDYLYYKNKCCKCDIPEPRIKNSENGIVGYCGKCSKKLCR